MKELNKVKMCFDSRSQNEAFARVAVSAFIAPLDPTIEQMNDIKSVVSEAVTNCIVHAYPDKIGRIELTLKILENGVVYIKVSDKGVGIEDVEKAMLPLFTTAPEGERAGLGFAVMESFTDKLKVKSRVGKGTDVTMTARVLTRPPKNAKANSEKENDE